MKINNELKKVIELMLERGAGIEGFCFGIPSELVNPDNVSDQEHDALERAGFVWEEDQEQGYAGYVLYLNDHEHQ